MFKKIRKQFQSIANHPVIRISRWIGNRVIRILRWIWSMIFRVVNIRNFVLFGILLLLIQNGAFESAPEFNELMGMFVKMVNWLASYVLQFIK